MTRRVGLIGGTFDPIHLGHLDLGEAAQNALQLTSVVALPAHVPPHRPAPVASVFHRFAMTAIAVAGREGWTASDLELSDPGYSFTGTTLQRMHAQGYRPGELFFVIGADAFADIQSWRGYPAILDLAHFAVVSRPGFPAFALRERLPGLGTRIVDAAGFDGEQPGTVIVLIDATTADVSSTIVRERLVTGEPVNEMLTPGVLQHIEQHGLYRSPGAGREDNDRGSLPAAGRLHGPS
jgi:nicotinate-nucleotide adenylyltransferase